MVGLGRIGVNFGFVGLAVLSNGLAPSASADSFHLKNGQVIEGKILKSTLNTLTLQSGGSIELAILSQIDRVVLQLDDGRELAGELLGWKDGVYELRSADLVLRVADGEVLLDDNSSPATTQTAAVPAPNESANTPAETAVMASLPSFIMKNGDALVGKILHATGSVLTIRPVGGSALPVSRAQIEAVNFEIEGSGAATGKLISWEDGVYQLRSDNRNMLATLPDNAIAPASPLVQVSEQEIVEENLDAPIPTEIEQADAAVTPPSDVEPLAVEPLDNQAPAAEVGVGGPANETAIAAFATDDSSESGGEPAAKIVNSQHLIETLVEAVDEGSEAAVVKFQLDKPAARPLVVLYAATESSAKAGEDFEAKSGVITFSTGSSYAEVRVPIIDDDQGEDSEKFNLFLSGDPETIAFDQRQISVTINDND